MKSCVPFELPRETHNGEVVCFDGRSTRAITFARLTADVQSARQRLVGAGVTSGDCVGIMAENCYEWLVFDLALLSLGAIPVAFPIDELAQIAPEELANRYALSLLLVTKRQKKSELSWQLVIDAEAPATARTRSPGPHSLLQRIAGSDCCTIIFSSGTSGKLKALLLSKAGVEDTIEALASEWALSERDGILVALPLSIFQQRLMVYAALRRGTRILLTDSLNLFRSFKALRPSIVLGPPALFETIESRFMALPERERRLRSWASALLRLLPFGGLRRRLRRRVMPTAADAFGGNVRVLITGSAPSKPATLRFFELSGLTLFQAYGLAEVGFIAWNRPEQNRALSVGKPVVPGSVRLGADGEVLVKVPHRQALGYFGVEPEEERLTFLADGGVATGDLGRFDEDGFLFLTGRKKDLILTQAGQKIHPQALELELGATPGVERVVVVGGGDLPGLVAVVAVPPDCSAEDEARVRLEIDAGIAALNQRQAKATRIMRAVITRVPFKPETGLVTRNLKIDRNAVHSYFRRELGLAGTSSGAKA